MAIDLSDLLSAERGRLREVHPAQVRAYNEIYRELVEIASKFGLDNSPQLTVVSSLYALPQLVTSRGETGLVYDQYLGQILSRLEALISQGASLDSIDAWLCKLYASRLLVNGKTNDALVVAGTHLVLRASDNFRVTENLDRYLRVHAQEMYAIAHELMHFVFKTNDKLRDLVQKYYFELCAAEASDTDDRVVISTEEFAAVLADDFNREHIRRHGPMDTDVLAEGRQQLIEHYARSAGPDLPNSDQIKSEGLLSEEVVCDAGALILTVLVLSDGTPLTSLDAIDAAFDASQKLRLIQSMDARINALNSEQILRDSTIRGRQLRQFIRAIYESGLTRALGFETTDLEYSTMLARIKTTNERFYATVFDQLLTGSFYERFKPLDNENSLGRGLAECWDGAATILGFPAND